MPEPGPSGGYTPDPVAVLRADLDEVKKDVAAIKAQLQTTPNPPQPVDDWGAAFRAKWARGTPAEFEKLYGMKFGEHLPPMPAFDEAEAIRRARFGYPTYGIRYAVNDAVADAAIEVISKATEATAKDLKETGYGLTGADVCAYGYRVGTFGGLGGNLGGGGAVEPWTYRGKDLSEMLASNFGGTPSG